jgi:diguanylate cyclase (GGDEF)-like protein
MMAHPGLYRPAPFPVAAQGFAMKPAIPSPAGGRLRARLGYSWPVSARPPRPESAVDPATLLRLIGSLPDEVLGFDDHLVCRYANASAARRWPGQLAGTAAWPEDLVAVLRRVLSESEAAELQLACPATGEATRVSAILVVPEPVGCGSARGVWALARDVTVLVRQREAVERLAFTDPLTGLANRSLLTTRLEAAAIESDRKRSPFGLMLIDLDDFKQVNDQYGHAVGDELLRMAVDRMRGCLRETDTLARVGGDEFALVLPGIGVPRDLALVAQRLTTALAEPFTWRDHPLRVSASVGIARYPADTDQVATMMSHADAALYCAKGRGRGSYHFYDAELTARAERRMAVEAALAGAVGRGDFHLVFQPMIALPSQATVGAEALLRWDHPTLGSVAPAEFIPAAESTGAIVGIGTWVLGEACRAATRINRDRDLPLKIAINISGRQFDGSFARRLESALQVTDCRPDWLEIEINEALLLENRLDFETVLTLLRDTRLRIAIDHFGTGHSALGRLSRFPVDLLKIDRSFITEIHTDTRRLEWVRGLVAMAHALKLHVVAEGVENAEQAALLIDAGCDFAQGWHFGRALTLDALVDAVALNGPARSVVE